MPPVIASGTCFAIHAFELGHSIDLDRCERIVAESARQTIRPSRRLPEHFAYRPAPLRLVQAPRPTSGTSGSCRRTPPCCSSA